MGQASYWVVDALISKRSDSLRLPNRFKQTFYVSNEIIFGSNEYDEPYTIRGLYIPSGETMLLGGGVMIQQNTDTVLFESSLKNVKDITQNSLFWIKREPNDLLFGEDFTHRVIGRQATSNSMFIVISLESVSQDVPVI